jgi:hypothetical protein
MDRSVFRQDRDAALALEIGVVHGALGDALVQAVGPALPQQAVHQRGFAMVDVGDDGDIPPERVGDFGRVRDHRSAGTGRKHLNSIQQRG